MPTTPNETPSLESLRQRYEKLNERKIQAKANLDSTTKQLEELEKTAIEKFGTAKIEELEAKLAEMTAENEKRLTDYNSLLDTIETDLAKVESDAMGKSSRGQEDA